tara:strand:+ start:6701 stop:8122 length:1422 start_codon:yes stop_codon:yes gene_type:complete
MAKQVINVGTTANDGTGDPIRTAFVKAMSNFDELYTDDTNDVNSIVATAPIARNNATGIVTISLDDNGVDATKLNVSGNGTTGQALTSDGDGSMSWTTMEVGDITAVTAGAGMTGGGTTGDVTLDAIGGTGITVNANDIQITDAGVTSTQLASDSVITIKIADDAVTADKLANSINTEITANTAKTGITSGQASAITANTAKVTNATHTGDVTGSGALTIANDAVTIDKIADAVIVTEAEGIGSNDNDTTLPTSAAVKNYVDTNDALAGFTKTDGNFLVADGTNFVVENGATVRDSIGLGTANHAQLHCLGIGQAASTVNGQINATTVYATTLGYDSNDKITFTNDTQIDFFVNGNNKARLEADGDWQVAGDVVAASTAFSDKRLKDNIKPIENSLEAIKKINGVTYDWKANGNSSMGVIAQEVQSVFPQLVKEVQPLEGDEKRLTVNYDGLIGVLIETVKELNAKIENLENK